MRYVNCLLYFSLDGPIQRVQQDDVCTGHITRYSCIAWKQDCQGILQVILLMVQKSGVHQLRLVVYPHYLQVFFYTPGCWPDFFHQQYELYTLSELVRITPCTCALHHPNSKNHQLKITQGNQLTNNTTHTHTDFTINYQSIKVSFPEGTCYSMRIHRHVSCIIAFQPYPYPKPISIPHHISLDTGLCWLCIPRKTVKQV